MITDLADSLVVTSARISLIAVFYKAIFAFEISVLTGLYLVSTFTLPSVVPKLLALAS